ncbi:hypothetical protein AA16373_0456 [Komagataeibacter swingsii DSM 16373]|nr:hypothetical protein AA16373_0456 [Komagataeibacter swingsii DSM 16373]
MYPMWISYKLREDKADDPINKYSDRYKNLMAALKVMSPDFSWSEPSSFHVINSKFGIETCLEVLKKAINPQIDIVVLGVFYEHPIYIIGHNENDSIYKLISCIKYS